MSLSQDRSTLSRLNQEIAALRAKEAGEVKKAAEAQRKINSALDSARRTNSASLAKSYLSTADRESKNLQTAQDNQSRYSSQAASKTKSAADLQDKIAKEEERERIKTASADDKRRRDEDARRKADEQRQRRANEQATAATSAMQRRIAELETQIAEQLEASASTTPAFRPIAPEGEKEAYDVFISHAWEDKEDFVEDLALKARDAGLRVWYDKFALQWGDSLRQKIDAGLAGSYFGIAVLSPSFFAKQWTQYELDGLLEKALSGAGRLLPIWHKVSKDEIVRYAPSMAGRLALNTSLMSADEIVAELKKLRDQYRANEADVVSAEHANRGS
jgi:hypothetical protein